jgi:hypothetical protein
MSPWSRTSAWLVVVIAAVSVSFAVGRWSGSLKRSLQGEENYPWELHRKIGSVDIQCDQLLQTTSTGHFVVRLLDSGATLVIASYDNPTRMVKAFALSSSGAIASDNWPMECN